MIVLASLGPLLGALQPLLGALVPRLAALRPLLAALRPLLAALGLLLATLRPPLAALEAPTSPTLNKKPDPAVNGKRRFNRLFLISKRFSMDLLFHFLNRYLL